MTKDQAADKSGELAFAVIVALVIVVLFLIGFLLRPFAGADDGDGYGNIIN